MAKDTREILRTVNVNEELYAPGDEDLLEDALDGIAEQDEDFDTKDELKRLTLKGHIKGFVDVDDEDVEGGTADQIANRGRARASAIVQKIAEKTPKGRGGSKNRSKPPRRKPKVMTGGDAGTGAGAAGDSADANGDPEE